MKKFKNHLVTAALVMASCAPATVMAESSSVTGGGTLSTDAHLNLQVIIPSFLYFRVGTDDGTINTITFAPLDSEVGNSTPIAGSGGNAGGGSGVEVALRSNAGQITIDSDNNTGVGLLSPGGETISLSEITVDDTGGNLVTPPLLDNGIGSISPPPTNGNITDRSGTWVYSYNNTTTPAAGTYDAEITYTAASP